MKIFVRVCSAICMVLWILLAVGAVVGYVNVTKEGYCLMAGLLAYKNLIHLIEGE